MTEQLELNFSRVTPKSYPTNSRWSLDLERNILRQREGSGSAPVLDIIKAGETCSQIGLNIRHLRQDRAYFSTLKGEVDLPTADKTFFKINKKELGHLFSRILYIAMTDPSISTLVFSKPYSFKIHLTDRELVSILDDETIAHHEGRVYGMLLKSEYKASSALLNEISGCHDSYALAMSLTERQYRENFYKDLMELAKHKLERLSRSDEQRVKLKPLKNAIKNAKAAGVTTRGLELELSRLERYLEIGKPITPEEIKKLHTEFMSNPAQQRPPMTTTLPIFTDVARLPTTIHERANKSYSADIVTYELTEPWCNHVSSPEVPEGNKIVVVPGFRERNKIIFAEA